MKKPLAQYEIDHVFPREDKITRPEVLTANARSGKEKGACRLWPTNRLRQYGAKIALLAPSYSTAKVGGDCVE